LTISIDYLPKIQARKIYTFAKEQLDIFKNTNSLAAGAVLHVELLAASKESNSEINFQEEKKPVEEIETEEVINFAEIIPVAQLGDSVEKQFPDVNSISTESALEALSQDELFEKLQNYKKLLDNGLILQGEYDVLKKEILSKM
jgi:hypothetical protein